MQVSLLDLKAVNAYYPISEEIHNEVLSLPISSVQNLVDNQKIVKIINAYRPI